MDGRRLMARVCNFEARLFGRKWASNILFLLDDEKSLVGCSFKGMKTMRNSHFICVKSFCTVKMTKIVNVSPFCIIDYLLIITLFCRLWTFVCLITIHETTPNDPNARYSSKIDGKKLLARIYWIRTQLRRIILKRQLYCTCISKRPPPLLQLSSTNNGKELLDGAER